MTSAWASCPACQDLGQPLRAEEHLGSGDTRDSEGRRLEPGPVPLQPHLWGQACCQRGSRLLSGARLRAGASPHVTWGREDLRMAGFQARKQVAVTGPGSPACLLPPPATPARVGELEPVLGLFPLGPGPACLPRARRAAHCLFSIRVCVLQPGDAVCHGSRWPSALPLPGPPLFSARSPCPR